MHWDTIITRLNVHQFKCLLMMMEFSLFVTHEARQRGSEVWQRFYKVSSQTSDPRTHASDDRDTINHMFDCTPIQCLADDDDVTLCDTHTGTTTMDQRSGQRPI